MKNFIILLSVIILALTGCGKSGDNKNEEVVLDINSTEDASTASKEITAEHTTVVKENQTTKANVDSETATTTNQTQTSKEESEEVGQITHLSLEWILRGTTYRWLGDFSNKGIL